MTKPDHTMSVTVGGVKIPVPVYEDAISTNAVVQEVNARLADIEANATRIDTQAFALQTAVSFAVELTELRRQNDWDQRELLQALNALLKTLRQTLEAAEGTDLRKP
ncbi:MAG: cell division protein ZapA [Candidatus Hydrogenedentes bacterium]|nr:cell division protein ZapA [Candidatus Hydrogenedentota bacterium]